MSRKGNALAFRTLGSVDIDIARQAINTEQSFGEIAAKSTLRDIVIITMVSLRASRIREVWRIGPYGPFGHLMAAFDTPVGESPLRTYEYPDYHREKLREMSAKLGLHQRLNKGGGWVVLIDHPLICNLLAEEGITQKAAQLAKPILDQCEVPTPEYTPKQRWSKEQLRIKARWGIDLDRLELDEVASFLADLHAAVERIEL